MYGSGRGGMDSNRGNNSNDRGPLRYGGGGYGGHDSTRNHDRAGRTRAGTAMTAGGVYVPPHLRENDIIRPESSMSNITDKTFASQAPLQSNYSYGPPERTEHMNPYTPGYDVRRAQAQRGFGSGNPLPRSGFDTQAARASATTNPFTTPVHAPTPMRRDSGAPGSRADYLAARIMRGEADNPFDPDYGNPGDSKRPAPPSAPKTLANAGNSLATSLRAMKVEDNTDGNAKVFLGSKKEPVPAWFDAALAGKQPILEIAFMDLPFEEACRPAAASTAGVVKILNIPYNTSRSDIIAFLGKNTQICLQPKGSSFYAVHIVMDRHSGKTMDAFIEVSTPAEAVWVVNSFQKRVMQKRPGKIGDRVVEVELSGQDELMKTLFHRAKQVTWESGVPIIDPKKDSYYPGTPATGFIGFLQDDEINHIRQHAEKPQRSPFVQRCMVRTYEYLVSTLHKYPWFAHEHVLLRERDALFDATFASVRCLIALLRRIHHDKPDTSKPTTNTLIELSMAVFVCPGFTDTQKASVASLLVDSGFGKLIDTRAINLHFGGCDKYAANNPFVALVKQPGVEDKVIDYFAALMRDATVSAATSLSLADLHAMRASNASKYDKLFGDQRVDYRGARTLADAGRAELRHLEAVLGRALPRARRGGSSAASGSTGLGGGFQGMLQQ